MLHVGHGLNNTLQDVLVRWRAHGGRRRALGARHGPRRHRDAERGREAARREGKTRDDLGREAFVARVREFADDTRRRDPRAARGASARACDWSRTAFTFDPELSRAVREVFVRLYDDGLIYRGHRVINWCPRCLTALSDEEAESR